MKALVQTTGEFQLLDTDSGQLIRYDGYTLIEITSFVKAQMAHEKLVLVAQTNDEATDEEWLKYVEECKDDLQLAVESFTATFKYEPPAPPAPETPAEPEQKPKGPKGKPVAPAAE